MTCFTVNYLRLILVFFQIKKIFSLLLNAILEESTQKSLKNFNRRCKNFKIFRIVHLKNRKFMLCCLLLEEIQI